MANEAIQYLTERYQETDLEIQDWLKRINKLQEQIQKGQEEVARLRQQLSWFRSEIEKASNKYGIDPTNYQHNLLTSDKTETKTTTPSLTQFTIADQVYTILKEEGRPLSLSQLAQKLVQSGHIKAETKNPLSSVSTALKRRLDIFEKVGIGMWQIRNEGKQEKIDDAVILNGG